MLQTPYDFSPDESQSLAGALTLRHDPRFWISVDGATAGPLHFFAQVPAAMFPAGEIYFMSRLSAVAVVLATLFVGGAIVRLTTRAWIEQVVVLSAAVAFAASRTPDFQHFSTELLPVLFVVIALWLSLGTIDPPSRLRLASMGVLLAMAPLAKLQVGPLALATGIFILGREIRNGRSATLLALIGGALLPVIATATYLTMADAWPQAAVPYLFTNVAYVELGSMSFAVVTGDLVHFLWLDGYVASWIFASAVLIVLGALWFGRCRRPALELGGIALGWILIASACMLLPRRPFLHYVYLIMPGWIMLLGCAITAISDRLMLATIPAQRRLIAVLLAVLLLAPAALHLLRFDEYGWERAYFARWHEENVDLAKKIKPYAREGDTMAIWGSRSDLYVLTKLPQAIPQAHSQLQISNGEWQRYYLRTYAAAFDRNRPAIFVDAVGPGNFLFKSRSEAHEAFPFLAGAVRSHYTLVADLHGTRVYVRNDRIPAAASGTSRSTGPAVPGT